LKIIHLNNNLSMKIYLLIIGANIQAFYSLSRLCKESGLNKSFIKENLPFESGKVKILEIEVDERL